jgi:hypothetical protein
MALLINSAVVFILAMVVNRALLKIARILGLRDRKNAKRTLGIQRSSR